MASSKIYPISTKGREFFHYLAILWNCWGMLIRMDESIVVTNAEVDAIVEVGKVP